jgi:hypothetical protein
MKIFKKAGQPPLTKIQKRIANLSTPELISWVESSLFVIGKEITHHQKTRNIESLYEMELAAEALLIIAQELKKRVEHELQ